MGQKKLRDGHEIANFRQRRLWVLRIMPQSFRKPSIFGRIIVFLEGNFPTKRKRTDWNLLLSPGNCHFARRLSATELVLAARITVVTLGVDTLRRCHSAFC